MHKPRRGCLFKILPESACYPARPERICLLPGGHPGNQRMEALQMRAYGEMEQHGKYTLEDFGGWSRNHTKAASIRRWKRPLKKRAGQVCRAALRRLA